MATLVGMATHYEKSQEPNQVSRSGHLTSSQTDFPVDVPEAFGLPPIQLDRLIFTLLPNDNGEMAQSDSIIWTPRTSSRHSEGLARVRIGSLKALREIVGPNDYKSESERGTKNLPKEEVVWHINYYFSENPPHAITSIDFGPNCLGDSLSQNDACSFNFKKIEHSSLYKSTFLCAPKEGNDFASITRVYLLKAPGKKEMLLSYIYSEGSGGGLSSLTLEYPSKKDEVCK